MLEIANKDYSYYKYVRRLKGKNVTMTEYMGNTSKEMDTIKKQIELLDLEM